MAIIINGKVYRNLQEQVGENTEDIEILQENQESIESRVNNTYTKGEIDLITEGLNESISTKASASSVYTKTEIDTGYYTKTQVDAIIGALPTGVEVVELDWSQDPKVVTQEQLTKLQNPTTIIKVVFPNDTYSILYRYGSDLKYRNDSIYYTNGSIVVSELAVNATNLTWGRSTTSIARAGHSAGNGLKATTPASGLGGTMSIDNDVVPLKTDIVANNSQGTTAPLRTLNLYGTNYKVVPERFVYMVCLHCEDDEAGYEYTFVGETIPTTADFTNPTYRTMANVIPQLLNKQCGYDDYNEKMCILETRTLSGIELRYYDGTSSAYADAEHITITVLDYRQVN